MRKRVLLSALGAAMILSGCGESASSAGSSSVTLDGKVADGYLVGAKVCLDKNANLACESDEPSAISTKGGAFSISGVTQSDIENYNIVAEITTQTIDEDTNQSVDKPYVLYANAKSKFVSPLTTQLFYMMDRFAVSDAETAKKLLADSMGLSDATLVQSDYVAKAASGDAEAQKAHEWAKAYAALRGKMQESVESANLNYTDFYKQQYVSSVLFDYTEDINASFSANQVDLATHVENVYATMPTTSLLISANLSSLQKEYEQKAEQERLEKLKESLNSTTPNLLTTSQILLQDVPYSRTYNGKTDLMTFTVADSANKSCTIYFLDSSFTSNSYVSGALQINGTGYSARGGTSVSLTKSTQNASFFTAWYYYTSTASHADFYVHCF